MSQPECAAVVVEPDPPPLPSRDLAAVWMIVALFAAVALFEWWAVKTKHRTISQRIQKVMRGRLGWQILATIGMGFLWWHLIRSGPW